MGGDAAELLAGTRFPSLLEDAYRWFDRVNVPSEFRAVTLIRLSPDREDDTKIECTAVIEQWFVPIAPEM
jgi:hypothetical protein